MSLPQLPLKDHPQHLLNRREAFPSLSPPGVLPIMVYTGRLLSIERGPFFRRQVHERVGKIDSAVCERIYKWLTGTFYDNKKDKKTSWFSDLFIYGCFEKGCRKK